MAWYTFIAAAVIFIILYSYLSNWKWKRSLKRLNLSRPKLSKIGYIEILAAKGYKREGITMAYDLLHQYIGIPDFSLYPEDDWEKDYQIDPEDSESLIRQIFERLALTLPEQEHFDVLNKKYKEKLKVEYVLELLKTN